MIVDLALETRRRNAIGDPLLYQIGVAGLISHYDEHTVASKPSFAKPRATAPCRSRLRPGWRLLRRPFERKAG